MNVEGPGIMDAGASPPAPVGFFTIADANYFLGLVALVNSLRLQGHADPITVLDLGLQPDQREVLETECEFVMPPRVSRRHPWLMEPTACLVRDADTVVYIDSDIIVTSPLDEIIEATREGRICVFEDVRPTRWFAEWEGIFDLRQAPRKQTYINAGFLAVSTRRFPEVLRRWSQCCEHLVGQDTHLETGSFDSPTALSSQDALNAVLMSDVELDQIDLQPTKSEAQGPRQLSRTRLVDRDRLTCHLDGHPTTLVHSWGTPKPWQPAARKTLRRGAYSECLRRLLVSRDVAVRVTPASVPIWLRPGLRGAWSFWWLTQARRPWRGGKRQARQLFARLSGNRGGPESSR